MGAQKSTAGGPPLLRTPEQAQLQMFPARAYLMEVMKKERKKLAGLKQTKKIRCQISALFDTDEEHVID